MVEATGFSQSEIERYVLSGVTPYLSNIEVRLQKSPNRTQGRIEVNWLTTDEQFRTAQREVRKALNFCRVKGLTESDQHLLELVKQAGEPPAKGSKGQKASWEERKAIWNADPRYKPYSNWRGLEMKHKRLQEKLKNLMPSHPAMSARPPV
jgi:hypothetical protein